MKLSKRILAVLLAGTMALALLAGCGSSVGSKDVDVINVMLQLNGSDVKVTVLSPCCRNWFRLKLARTRKALCGKRTIR